MLTVPRTLSSHPWRGVFELHVTEALWVMLQERVPEPVLPQDLKKELESVRDPLTDLEDLTTGLPALLVQKMHTHRMPLSGGACSPPQVSFGSLEGPLLKALRKPPVRMSLLSSQNSRGTMP